MIIKHYVFFDPDTKAITYTMSGEERLVSDKENWIEVETPLTGELSDWSVIDGDLVMSSIEGKRAGVIERVNTAIGEIRARYITVLPGQEILYMQKEAEARAFLADPDPDLTDYPLIAAEIGITGVDAQQVAQIYLNLANILRSTAAQLEQIRLGAVSAAEGATLSEELDTILAGFNATLEMIP